MFSCRSCGQQIHVSSLRNPAHLYLLRSGWMGAESESSWSEIPHREFPPGHDSKRARINFRALVCAVIWQLRCRQRWARYGRKLNLIDRDGHGYKLVFEGLERKKGRLVRTLYFEEDEDGRITTFTEQQRKHG